MGAFLLPFVQHALAGSCAAVTYQSQLWHPPAGVVRRLPARFPARGLGVRAKMAECSADRVWERGGVSDEAVEYVPLCTLAYWL